MKPLKKEALDQATHFTMAGIVVAVLSLLGYTPNPSQGWFIGWALGCTREFTEDRSLADWGWGSWRDIIFWSLGGLVVAVIL